MEDEKKTFTIKEENLQANTPQTETSESPLNTGNGSAEPPAQTTASETPAPETPTQPAETQNPAPETPTQPAETQNPAPETPTPETPAPTVAPETPVNEQLMQNTTRETSTKTNSLKKYILLIVILTVIIIGGYFAYGYFFSTTQNTNEETPAPINTLSSDETTDNTEQTPEEQPTEEMKALDNVVNDLENVYAPPTEEDTQVLDNAVLQETDDSFPNLTKPAEEDTTTTTPALGEPPLPSDTSDTSTPTTDLKVLR